MWAMVIPLGNVAVCLWYPTRGVLRYVVPHGGRTTGAGLLAATNDHHEGEWIWWPMDVLGQTRQVPGSRAGRQRALGGRRGPQSIDATRGLTKVLPFGWCLGRGERPPARLGDCGPLRVRLRTSPERLAGGEPTP